jgi:tetratricopeptide (TPR) repeat protein
VSHAWRDFKTKPTPTGGASRFTASLGSHRYDFWRVAVDRFAAHPLAGIGSANFQQDYLARGKSYEQPRFPHSLELGVLSQTGLVGAALLVVALGSAIAAGVAAVWRRSGIGSAVAAGALGSFVYWVIHGSIDWFWEFPGVAAAAFALLGLAAGLEPRRPAPAGNPGAASPLVDSPRLAVPLAAGVLVALASFGAPWMSELYSDQAADSWARSPATAFYKLDRAASLDPLSARPKLLAGSIALRLQSWNQAERYFNQALDRDPRDAYAHLELGALASQQGRRAQAEALLGQAVKLSPRDAISAFALGRVRDGRTVTTTEINNQLLARTRRLLK